MPPSKRSTEGFLEAAWRRRGPAAVLLLPLAGIFVVLRCLRRCLYRIGVFRTHRLPVPVIVVGNITVGGIGKTPLVIFLARELARLGWRPGIVSRGYGSGGGHVAEVDHDADPGLVGDEPVLLRRRAACPVVVGVDRVAAARHLLAAHPEIDVILGDDGLQHYRLDRRLEIAVTRAGAELNGWPLPAGPMREPRSRLDQVDAVVEVMDAVPPAPTFGPTEFAMVVRGGEFYLLAAPERKATATDFAGKHLHAVAGIGSPQRFFRQLDRLGIAAEAHAFPDHHVYSVAELVFIGEAILTTEKDAVKLARLSLPLPVWVLPLEVTVEPDLAQFVVEKLNGRAPA